MEELPARFKLKLVLDTNVVLDWLVFADQAIVPLKSAIAKGRVELQSHLVLIDELWRVLDYPQLTLGRDSQIKVREAYTASVSIGESPLGFSRQALLIPNGFPRCGDPDDDIFLAFAYHSKAVLVSKDRAVLKMKRRVRRFGVTVVDPVELADLLSAG